MRRRGMPFGMPEPTRPSEETREAERSDATKHGSADRAPSPAEEASADQLPGPSESVREHEQDMAERGAGQKGEGRIA